MDEEESSNNKINDSGFSDYLSKTKELNRELVKFRNIAEGKGIRGFVHKHITKSSEKYRMKCEGILSELYKITLEFEKLKNKN